MRNYYFYSMRSVILGITKIAPQKNAPYEYSPLWKLPPVKITPQNFSPEKIAPCENYPQWNLLPTCKSYKWKKKQNYKFFCLEENPYQAIIKFYNKKWGKRVLQFKSKRYYLKTFVQRENKQPSLQAGTWQRK